MLTASRADPREGVGQLQIVKVCDSGSKVDRSGQNVKSLVDTFLSCRLRTQDTAITAVQQFQVNWRGVWIVLGMVQRMDNDRVERNVPCRSWFELAPVEPHERPNSFMMELPCVPR